MSDAEEDHEQPQEHTTKKRKRVSKKLAVKKNIMNREDRIAHNRLELKQDFEKERDEILEAIPDDYKAMLGQIGFAKWSKNLVPVLILSPFDLPPGVGSVREQWMHMYEKLSSQGRLANLSYVIYFYGSATTASPYSFIQQTKFIPYEKEKAKTKKSVYQLPAKLQKKIEAGAKISGSDAYLVTAYEEMEEDLQKPAEDRKRGITGFKECYDVLSDHELDVEALEADSEGSDDFHLEGGNSDEAEVAMWGGPSSENKSKSAKKATKSKSKNKKPAKKKARKKELPADGEGEDSFDGAESGRPEVDDLLLDESTQQKSKTVKKKKKKKAKADTKTLEIDIGEPEEAPKMKKAGRPKKSAEGKTNEADSKVENLEIASPGGVVDSDGIGDEEESGSDDQDSAFDGDSAVASEADDAEDELLVEDSKKGSKKAVSREKKQKPSVAKKPQKAKHKEARPVTEDRKKKIEKDALKESEKKYLPLIENWISAVREKNVQDLHVLLADAHKVVEEFSATFTLSYGISAIMKETKHVLKSANADLTVHSALREKLKKSFYEKNAQVPDNYKPKISRPEIADKANNIHLNPKAPTVNNLDESQRAVTGKAEFKSPPKDTKVPRKEDAAASGVAFAKSPPKVHGDGTKSPPPRFGRETSGGDARPATQPKPKKFRLGSLMGRAKESAPRERGTESTLASEKKPVAAESSSKGKESSSCWWKAPPSIDAPKDDPRALALEFLLQAATHFDAGSVNCDSLARALEAAIYDWAQKQNGGVVNWTALYWDKLHALNSAICGKQEKGSLMSLIVQGNFDAPDKLVALSDDQLFESFEGRPLSAVH